MSATIEALLSSFEEIEKAALEVQEAAMKEIKRAQHEAISKALECVWEWLKYFSWCHEDEEDEHDKEFIGLDKWFLKKDFLEDITPERVLSFEKESGWEGIYSGLPEEV